MTARPGTPAPCPGTCLRSSPACAAAAASAWISSTAWPSASPRRQVERQGHRRELALVVDRQRFDLRGEMRERARAAPARRSARRRRSWTAPSGRPGIAARPRGSPCTGWSRCTSSRPGAGRTRRRASASISDGEMPSREAASRSISIAICGAATCWSEATSSSCGSFRIAASRIGAQWFSSSLIGVGQRVLVLGAAEPAADRDVLARLHEELGALDRGDLGPQALDDLVRAQLALVMRLELDEHARGVFGRVVGVGAGERDDAGNAGSCLHDIGDLVGQLPPSPANDDVLARVDLAEDEAGVLLREKSLGDRHVEIARDHDQRQASPAGSGTDGGRRSRARGRRRAASTRSRSRRAGSSGLPGAAPAPSETASTSPASRSAK